ncbi:MAG: hypothetical protein AMK75_01985 [Planctomycetes bacterium SM23_65]|nr:MAG: hypothetical protein AMK75_01985 [Planctomycetes bacterium SM23_65]
MSILVAVSGGSDSVALALVMHEAREGGKISPLHFAHLNHQIRGKGAERDAQFVQRLAESLGVPLTSGKTDVPATARERRISLEHAARECRYEFLEATARGLGARWVAVGHTADDQLETILHNLLRGAGVHGLAGMPRSRPISPASPIRIIRPLTEYPRRQLIDYLESRSQQYCTDHTNLDTTYTRNRIRHELIPRLQQTWPDIRSEMTEFARELGALDELLESVARRWTGAHAVQKHRTFEAALDDLNALDEPLLSYVIRQLIADTLGDLRRIDEVHVAMIADLAAAGSTGASLDLPRGLIVRRGYKSLCFEIGQRKVLTPGSDAAAKVHPETPQPLAAKELAVPGETHWGTWTFEATVLEGKDIWEELVDLSGNLRIPEFDEPPTDPHERMRVFIRQLRGIDPEAVEYLDFDRIAGETLSVRGRVPGDRFTPLGAPGQTKLKEFFIRRKVPRSERDAVPLIVAGDRVLVVARLGVSDDVALTEDTRRILKISATAQDR